MVSVGVDPALPQRAAIAPSAKLWAIYENNFAFGG
jgi:hypothetical protein